MTARKVLRWFHDWYDECGADTGMWQKGYRDRRVLIFRKVELGQNAWNEVMWLRRTSENAQDEILYNNLINTK